MDISLVSRTKPKEKRIDILRPYSLRRGIDCSKVKDSLQNTWTSLMRYFIVCTIGSDIDCKIIADDEKLVNVLQSVTRYVLTRVRVSESQTCLVSILELKS